MAINYKKEKKDFKSFFVDQNGVQIFNVNFAGCMHTGMFGGFASRYERISEGGGGYFARKLKHREKQERESRKKCNINGK